MEKESPDGLLCGALEADWALIFAWTNRLRSLIGPPNGPERRSI
jgi:hypothetical protein